MSERLIVVIGGGISGLTVAWRLRELGVRAEVFEADEIVGGLAGTVRPEDGRYCLDFGPHFFITQKPEIVARVDDLLRDSVIKFKRSAQLYVRGRFLDYPLSARNVLFNFPPLDALRSVLSFAYAQVLQLGRKLAGRQRPAPDFGEWSGRQFGTHLTHIFFKPYTENFWKLPCAQLAPDVLPASTRLNFMKSLKLLFMRGVKGNVQSLIERELVLPLRYPVRGYGMLAEGVAERVRTHGGVVHVGARVTAVEHLPDGRYSVAVQQAGAVRRVIADGVVCTLPVPQLVQMLTPAVPPAVLQAAGKLGYLSLIVLYVVTRKTNLLATSYVYYLGRPYHRLAEMNKFCTTLCPPDENMLAIEFSCHAGDPIWRSSADELLALSMPHLVQDGILEPAQVVKKFLVRAPNAYPIRYLGYRENLEAVRTHLEQLPGLALLGRTGEYQYIDSDQCMERAIELADSIAAAGGG